MSDESIDLEKGVFPNEIEKKPGLKPGANLLFLSQSAGFHAFVQRVETVLQSLPVFKDLFLIIRPTPTWNRILASRRGAGFAFMFYVFPMMLLVALVEGHGLILLGREQVVEGMNNRFTLSKVCVYESASWLLALALVFMVAAFIKSLANTCHSRNHFSQSLLVMFHAVGPMYLIQLLNGFPHMYLWLSWLAGVTLAIGALYNGLPRILNPDPPSAMGLYVGSTILVFLSMLGGRLLTYYYLNGQLRTLEKSLSGIAARLPF